MSDNSDSNGGAPENNGNAEKHGLFSDREKLYNRLEAHEQRLVVDIATDLLERVDGDVGAYEREAIRNIALDTVKRARANEYIVGEQLMQEGSERSDRANLVYSRVLSDTTKELEKLGLIDDSPEARKAGAMEQGWMNQIEQATEESADDE